MPRLKEMYAACSSSLCLSIVYPANAFTGAVFYRHCRNLSDISILGSGNPIVVESNVIEDLPELQKVYAFSAMPHFIRSVSGYDRITVSTRAIHGCHNLENV